MDFSASALSSVEASAIENNSAEFLCAFGRAGGGEERVGARIRWIIGGSPLGYYNAVVRASLGHDEAAGEIAASIDCMRRRAVSGTWHLGPLSTPTDLAELLLARGFRHDVDEMGMAVKLDRVPRDIIAPPELIISRVRGGSDLAAWVNALGRGFGEGLAFAEWAGGALHRFGFDDSQPWRHYLGRLGGKPVATATLFEHGGNAGIYFVSTVPAFRRRGIGSAVTLAALWDAGACGCSLGVLRSSSQAVSMYKRLGFVTYCKVSTYELHVPLS